jgi:glycine/D-amino acid oxidase-like deaminating enzyme
MHAAVIGAGAFGGWIALFIRRLGWRVTLIDAWGAGNSRASSGGETRIIRSIYGNDRTSVRLAARSLALWKEHEQRWQKALYVRTGMLFLATKDDPFLAESQSALADENIGFESLSVAEASRRFPQISFEDIGTVLFEQDAGALFARENCSTVVEHLVAEGGEFITAAARRPSIKNNHAIFELTSGDPLQADMYVFACGPWMGQLFPEVIGSRIQPTRQEVLFFGAPPGDVCFNADAMPCWADRTSELKFYGLPSIQNRGFKLASDLRGPVFDPNTEDRVVAPSTIATVREYVRHRFPNLADAPLVESRVCQYENSPDLSLIVDRHPEAANVWLIGGGSGHGYKHGPAIGEYVAGRIASGIAPPSEFGLARFAATNTQGRSSTI